MGMQCYLSFTDIVDFVAPCCVSTLAMFAKECNVTDMYIFLLTFDIFSLLMDTELEK